VSLRAGVSPRHHRVGSATSVDGITPRPTTPISSYTTTPRL
jgi:hypothetical protein